MGLIINPLRSFTASTTQAPETGLLGRCFEDDNGAVYKLIQAGEAVSAGDVATLSATDDTAYNVDQSDADSIPAGVFTADLAEDEYGFIQVSGLADVNAISTVASGHVAFAAAAGEANSATVSSATARQLACALGKVLQAPTYSGASQTVAAKVQLKGLK